MKNFRAAAFCSWPMPRRTSQSVGGRIGDLMPMVPVNSVVGHFKDLNNIPIRSRGTQTIFIRFSDRSSPVPTFRPVTRSWMVIAPYTSPLSSYGCALHRPGRRCYPRGLYAGETEIKLFCGVRARIQ